MGAFYADHTLKSRPNPMPHPLAHLSWLFLTPKKTKNTGLSSVASFSPAKVGTGNEWPETTTPSMRSVKKNIILGKNISFEHPHDILAQLEWLRCDDFEIYLCIVENGKKIFHRFNGCEDITKLSQLALFDPEKDYEELGEYVAQDNAVVINTVQASQINKCLEKLMTPDPSSNALNTQTTLRFHYYPEKISNIHQFCVHLKACTTDEAKRSLYEKHKEYICNFESMIQCMIAWPGNAKEIWESYKIQKKDLKKHYYTIDSFKNFLILLPQEFDNIHSFFETDGDALFVLNKAYLELHSSEAETFFDKFKIKTVHDFDFYDHVLPQVGNKLLEYCKQNHLKLNRNHIITLLEKWPQGASEIWSYYKYIYSSLNIDTIQAFYGSSEPDLTDIFLKCLPEKAQQIWNYIENKQSIPSSMLNKFLTCWPEGASEIWSDTKHNKHLRFILANFLKIMPDKAQEIWRHFKEKEEALGLVELIDCIDSWPEGTEIMLSDFKNQKYKSISPWDIGKCLKKHPKHTPLLITEFFHHIKDEYDLLKCMREWQEGLNMLWDYMQDRQINLKISTLACLLYEHPHEEQRFINYAKEKKYIYQDLLSISSLSDIIIFALKLFPEHSETFISKLNGFKPWKFETSHNLYLEQYPCLIPQVYHFLIKHDKRIATSKLAEIITYKMIAAERYLDIDDINILPDLAYTILKKTYSISQTSYEKITRLYLGDVNKENIDEIINFIHRHPLNSLSMIEISNCSAAHYPELLRLLKEFESRQCLLIILPKSAKDKVELPLNFKIRYGNEKIHFPNTHNMLTHIESKRSSPSTHQSEVKQSTSAIYIADNGLTNKFTVENTNPTYKMISPGEFLNSDNSEISVRTGIIKLNFSNLSQTYEEPLLYTPANPPPVMYTDNNKYQDYLAECKSKNVSIARYVQFHQALIKNQRTRLLSIDAAETCEAYLSDPVGQVKIEKGDDGFYYALAQNNDCTLNYVLKAAPQQKLKEAYENIPQNHYTKKIIDEFKANPSIGSCRHRVAAVYKKIIEHPEYKQDDARMVDIDHKHMRIEIKYQGTYHQVDLGGNEARLTYDNDKTVYKAHPTPKPAQNTGIKSLFGRVSSYFSSSNSANTAQQSSQPISKISQQPLSGNDQQQLSPPSLIDTTPAVPDIIAEPQRVINPIRTVSKIENFYQDIFSPATRKILIGSGNAAQLSDQANCIMAKTRKTGHQVFYLNHPNMLNMDQDHVWLDSNGQPLYGKHSLLEIFLNNSTEDDVLMIDWEAFSPQQRLQLNHLFGRECRIRGKIITTPPKIVGFCHTIPDDDGSFTSRYNMLLNTTSMRIPVDNTITFEKKSNTRIIAIDLEGYADWEEKLFGKIIQTKAGLKWQKSQFADLLNSEERIDIVINNASDPIALEAYLKRAENTGYFPYQAYKIHLKDNRPVRFSCNTKAFDFNEFKSVSIEQNITSDKIDFNTSIIDTHLFDSLLSGKQIVDGEYDELDGLIKNHSKQNQKEIITLFISSNLTEAQYYCLLSTAKKHGVSLHLQFAPNIKLPLSIKTHINISSPAEEKHDGCTRVYITSNQDQIQNELCNNTKGQPPLVLHVEDYKFSDLIYNIQYDTTPSGFKNFKVIKSDILTELEKGRDVILRGVFSDSLLSELKPLLTGQTILLPSNEEVVIQGKGKLKLIIDRKNKLDLDWLDPTVIQQCETRNTASIKLKPTILYQEKYAEEKLVNLSNSAINSDVFINNRKNKFINALEEYTLLQLVGESGVGKSHLLADIAKNKAHAVYHELTGIHAWASDKTSSGMKILFIDESNIYDKHLTLFAPLKNKNSAEGVEILYQGKLYKLTENHKVVFARNPLQYGGGRVRQNLFADNSIPEIHLVDFPDAYIYENILKPVFKHVISSQNTGLFTSNKSYWQDRCKSLIQEYRDNRQRYTVREIQEKLIEEVKGRILPKLPTGYPGFPGTPTKEQAQIIQSLQRFIQIKQSIRNTYSHDLNGLGLNGYLLKGKPGTGKTEMMECALTSLGYQEATLEDEHKENDMGHYFYKIDASSSLAKKKEILIKALNEGNPFFVDELDGCIDDGFEKILNAVLTGVHPDTKQPATRPGCFGFFTGNGAGLKGRDFIGPAIRHRCVVTEVGHYNKNALTDIFNEKMTEETLEQRQKRVDEFYYLQHAKNWNLRGYFEYIEREDRVKLTNLPVRSSVELRVA